MSNSLPTLNKPAQITLLLLSFAGLWGTWGIGFRTGFLDLIKARLTANDKRLPSVEVPLKETYTLLPPVDALIRRLNVFLWPAIDGRWPGLTLVAWEFSGQFSGTWMVAGLEGLRRGNEGKVLASTTIVGILSQTITYGTILPLYLFVHLLTSSTSLALNTTPGKSKKDPAADLLVDPVEAAAWPIAFAISYLLPTLLVSFPAPRFVSFTTRQNIMAFWELYPIPFKILQVVLAHYFSSYLVPRKASPNSVSERKAQSLQYLGYVYAFSALVGGVTHIITLTLSFSAMFFPSIFTPAVAAQLTPSHVFLVNSPLSTAIVADMGEGLWHFLKWNMNTSNIAPVVWALVQYRNAIEGRRQWEGWSMVLTKVLGIYTLGGSAVATAWLMWRRDEIVLGEGAQESGKEKKIT